MDNEGTPHLRAYGDSGETNLDGFDTLELPSSKSSGEVIHNTKSHFFDTNEGHLLLLQGGIGSGKTFALESHFVNSFDTLAASMAIARGNPFNRKTSEDYPYHVWRIILESLLDSMIPETGSCSSFVFI